MRLVALRARRRSGPEGEGRVEEERDEEREGRRPLLPAGDDERRWEEPRHEDRDEEETDDLAGLVARGQDDDRREGRAQAPEVGDERPAGIAAPYPDRDRDQARGGARDRDRDEVGEARRLVDDDLAHEALVQRPDELDPQERRHDDVKRGEA